MNYKAVKKGGKATNSDHFTEYLDVDLDFSVEKPERVEVFHFKDKEAQAKFKDLTTSTEDFSKCFTDENDLQLQIKNWQKVLETYCYKAFKKIRIKKKKLQPLKNDISNLINKRNQLEKDNEKRDIVDKIEEEVAEKEAEENRKVIVENFKHLADNPENINLLQMWKLYGKLWPKTGVSLPTAKRNHKGKIISAPREIKKLLSKEYKNRLRCRPYKPDMKHLKIRKEKIFQLKMKLAMSKRSPYWCMKYMDKALSTLKNNKSHDCEGYINEIFKRDVIGYDLKKSLLEMFNKLKQKKRIGSFMNIANITTVQRRDPELNSRTNAESFRYPSLGQF